MANNINMRRLQTRIEELFYSKIDMNDFPDESACHFETRALAAFALLMVSGLEINQACLQITDGYRDMGIDAIYLDEIQKKLFIVQSKWRREGVGAATQDEIANFAQGIKRILEEDLEGANSKILAKSMDIDTALTKMDYQIHAIFVHTGNQKADRYVLRPISTLIDETNDDISTILLFSEFNFKDVYMFLANGQEQDEIDIDDVILSNWGSISEPFTSYYGTISAATIGEWYKRHGNSLFAKNIRFYKGNTDVNEGMKKVLLSEPEKFFYYNNGIKVLCKSIHRKAKDSTTNATGLFALEGVSLVNGAQTTGTIGEIFLENPEQVAKAFVMIQIIDLSNVEPQIATQITRLSNTQNRIESKDFVALDAEQERLRVELMFAHYTYLYKSGDQITNMDKQVAFDEAIVALACLHPDISYAVLAKSNVGVLSEDIDKAPYKALINASTNSYAMLNAVLCMRVVENYLQTKKETAANSRERLVCIHGNRFILHFILRKMQENKQFMLAVMEKELIEQEVNSCIENLVLKTTQYMDSLFPESYPANIFKNATKCKRIEAEIGKM